MCGITLNKQHWINQSKLPVNFYCTQSKEINDFEKIAKSILKYELLDLTEQGYETVQQKNIYHIGKQLSYVYNKASKNVSQFMMNRNEIL